jgi:hypothetical protein
VVGPISHEHVVVDTLNNLKSEQLSEDKLRRDERQNRR